MRRVGAWGAAPEEQDPAATLGREWFPWAWAKKEDPQRVVATLKLLGAPLFVKLFAKDRPLRSRARMEITGNTDSKGSSFRRA